MDRRQFLHSTAATVGLSALGLGGQQSLAQSKSSAHRINKVVVIGAGIVGAAIAYNLSRRGCEVVVVDKVGPAAQASGNSFAWLNASYVDEPHSYFALRTHSISEYHHLAAEIDIDARWSGGLEWYHSTELEQEFRDGVRRIQEYGSATHLLSPEQVQDLEPKLQMGTNRPAVYSPRDGAVDPAKATRALLEGCEQQGGKLIYPANVTAIEERRDGVTIKADVDSVDADLVVVAAGTGANAIARQIGLHTDLLQPATPGIMVTTKPLPPLINAVAYTSDSHFHQLNDGRMIVGEKAGPPQTAEHRGFLSTQANQYPDQALAEEHADRVIAVASKYLPELAGAEIDNVGIGWRPLPLDRLPVIGRPKAKPRVYLAATHSGVTLAPIIGRLAAMEILDDLRVDLLEDFRVERF